MRDTLFLDHTEESFNRACLATFHYQYQQVGVYQRYVDLLGLRPQSVEHYRDIPFLPISFFKTQSVIAKEKNAAITFRSSGTTGMVTSQHMVASTALYEQSFQQAFHQFYGAVEDIAILALLPSYLEREGSSLIYMVDDLIRRSEQPESDYFLYNHEELHQVLHRLKAKGTKTLLIGVTYALLDFVEAYAVDFPELIVMETGGMKGKRKEMIRAELHHQLCAGFGVAHIHSEYGMTELLSQGYSSGGGHFFTPSWMRVLLRDTNDPLTLLEGHKTGALNIIDLANYYSCSFIATQDLGKVYQDGSFEVLGRFDQADIRGCNLLVQ